MGNLLGRFFGGLEIKQGVTDDHVREFFDVLACHAIGKNEGLPSRIFLESRSMTSRLALT